MRIVHCTKDIGRVAADYDYAAVWNGARWEIYTTATVHGKYMANINCIANLTDRMFENHFESVDV